MAKDESPGVFQEFSGEPDHSSVISKRGGVKRGSGG